MKDKNLLFLVLMFVFVLSVNVYSQSVSVKWYCFVSGIFKEDEKCKFSKPIFYKEEVKQPEVGSVLVKEINNTETIYLKGEKGNNGKDGENGTTTIVYKSEFLDNGFKNINTQYTGFSLQPIVQSAPQVLQNVINNITNPTTYISTTTTISTTTVIDNSTTTYITNNFATTTYISTTTFINTPLPTNATFTNATITNATATNMYIQDGKIFNVNIDNVKILNGTAVLLGATITSATIANLKLGNCNATGTSIFSVFYNSFGVYCAVATPTTLTVATTSTSSSVLNSIINTVSLNLSGITSSFSFRDFDNQNLQVNTASKTLSLSGPNGVGLVATSSLDNMFWNLDGNIVDDTKNFIGSTNNKDLVFKTNGVEKVRLFSNAAPTYSLGFGATSLTSAFGGATSYSGPTLWLGNSSNISGTSGLDIIIDNDNNSSNSQFRIKSNADNASATMLFSVNESGNVGVGVDVPINKLEVFGDIKIGNSGANGCVKDFSGGTISGTCSSDERLKINISVVENLLEKLQNIKVVKYFWNNLAKEKYNNDTNIEQLGFTAQNVEDNFPELVITNTDGFKQVNYSKMSLYTLVGLQDLTRKIKNLGEGNAEKIKAKEICLGETCIVESDLKEFLDFKKDKMKENIELNKTTSSNHTEDEFLKVISTSTEIKIDATATNTEMSL